MNQVKAQLALIRDARAADSRFQKVTWMDGGRDQAGAHKLGAGAQHICNYPVCLEPAELAFCARWAHCCSAVRPRGVPGVELTRGLGWESRLGTHISVCLLFFFFNFKGKGCLGRLRGISQHLVSPSKLHSWRVNTHAATAKEALRLREEI